MDKNTISNYGWIVIAVLVLSIMIALATPFGQFIQKGTENALFGLINTSDNAFEATGLLGNNPNGGGSGDDSSGTTREDGKPYFGIPYMVYDNIVNDDNTKYPIASIIFYENGSSTLYLYSTESVTKAPAGTLSYKNNKIISSDEYSNLGGTLSADGKQVSSDDIVAILNETQYTITKNVTYEGKATVQDGGQDLTVCFSMKLNNDDSVSINIYGIVDGVKQELETVTIPAGGTIVRDNAMMLNEDGAETFFGFLTGNNSAIIYIDDIGVPLKTVDPTTNHTTIAKNSYYGNALTKTLYDKMPAEPSFCDFYLCGDYLYAYWYDKNDANADPQYDYWEVGLAVTGDDAGAKIIMELCPDFKYTDRLQTAYDAPLASVAGKPVCGGNSLYAECVNLTVDGVPTLPNTLNNLNFAFQGCTFTTIEGLDKKIPNSVKYFTGTFTDCTNLTTTGTFKIPNGAIGIQYMFDNCSSLQDASGLIIPDSVKLAEGLFADCTSLQNNGIPYLNKVEELDGMFANCVSLTYFDNNKMSQVATSMGGMFRECTSISDMSNLIIPNTMKNMSNAFYGCTALTTASTIPSSVTNMTSTFQGCSSLTGNVIINATPNSHDLCFYETEKTIYIKGSCSNKSELKSYHSHIYI